MKKALLLLPVLMSSQGVLAEAFEECPAPAFLTQGSIPKTYGVDLVTGDYRVLADDMGVTQSVNAIGFNPVDNFAYGWSYQHKGPVRIHADMSVEPLKVENISNASGFFVGDVHPENGKYYVYRRGSDVGLYSIDVDVNSPDYLTMKLIVDGVTLGMSVADLSINPVDGMAYTVDSNGRLYQIDLDTGGSQILQETGVTGGFGAGYFDPDGNLYVGRNSDGVIFKVAIGAGDYTMQEFARGPSASINDGWRCALAPITGIAKNDVDYGDAPDSYGTYLANNGARHSLNGDAGLFLGAAIDGESDASAYPLSDDENGRRDDDDGVQFATSIVGGRNSIMIVEASKPGFLNAWIDLDRNGKFDSEEQVSNNYYVNEGKQSLYTFIPQTVVEGESWARFRLSSVPNIGPTGGVSDGEVEDYKVKLVEEATTVSYYPTNNSWTTLAFEDNWPHEGDYDMNDLVVYMRTAVHRKNAGVSRVEVKAEVAAVGAAYHNGFAIRLPGIKRSQVNLEEMELEINGKPVTDFQPLEEGRDEAILIVTYNVWDFVNSGELCLFYRTEPGCGSNIEMNFYASIPLLEPAQVEVDSLLDPFLFATPGAWHGDHLVTAPGRSYEIHLKNQEPTEAFDSNLFAQDGDDSSIPEKGLYYQTEKGMPWALEIGTRWDYPIEYHDISHAYTSFQQFAESNGQQSSYWYDPAATNSELIFKN